MTTPVTTGAGQSLQPLRLMFSLALLGYAALHLGFQLLTWIIPAMGTTLVSRSLNADFLDLLVLSFPLVAVLIATHLAPQLAAAKVLSLVALVEYAVAVFFGAIAFLIGLGGFGWVDTFPEAVQALGHMVLTVARLGLVALAGYAVLRVFLALGGRITVPAALKSPTP
ncbi:hypothetical protein CS0771_35240 [Catellatospora sp. IY07-71]|uniref:hypothetical protein n=1 Tax=Catellatospora sp. IY07-71 TaxID=2728827 RepID=UPI001BB3427C|nr:hypothetical protein [Catellatospora sp. IY07-71]BCJ73980.1 hypothetical protein CS0771_35240 [Catellatospora sp. IY07-71]